MDLGDSARTGRGRDRFERVSAAHPGFEKLTAKQLNARLKKLENTMYGHARDLEFEDAARLRDEIAEIKTQYFKTSEIEAL
jgi:excinuclease ABC subunit B